jgi:hypothetical protein
MEKQFDIYTYLEQNRKIAAIWSTDDVQEVRPDFDTDEAWELLQEVERRCSTEFGINYPTLREIACELYSWAGTKD